MYDREQFWKDLLSLVKEQADKCTNIELCMEIIDSIHDDNKIPAVVKSIWRRRYIELRKQEECLYERTQTFKCIQVTFANINTIKQTLEILWNRIDCDMHDIRIHFHHSLRLPVARNNDWLVCGESSKLEVVSDEQFQKEFKKK